MSKEFHVFTHQGDNHEQAFVFEVERFEEDESVEFRELWLVTTQKSGEVRTRVKLGEMIQHMIETKGGNVDDDGVTQIMEVFDDIIPKDRQVEITEEIGYKETCKLSSEELINASDFALIMEEKERVENEKRTGTT